MNAIGITEAKKRWSELLRRAAAGEQIVITRRGNAAGLLIAPRASDSYKEKSLSNLPSQAAKS